MALDNPATSSLTGRNSVQNVSTPVEPLNGQSQQNQPPAEPYTAEEWVQHFTTTIQKTKNITIQSIGKSLNSQRSKLFLKTASVGQLYFCLDAVDSVKDGQVYLCLL